MRRRAIQRGPLLALALVVGAPALSFAADAQEVPVAPRDPPAAAAGATSERAEEAPGPAEAAPATASAPQVAEDRAPTVAETGPGDPATNSELEPAKLDEEPSKSSGPRISGSLVNQVYAREFYPASVLNPENILDVPVGFLRYGAKLRADYSIGSRVRLLADTYGQFRTQLHQDRSADFVTGLYILQLNAKLYLTDEVSVSVGKHLENIGTSLSEQILIPYQTYANRRENEGVNVVDDEGYWAAVVNFNLPSFALHLDYLPAYKAFRSSEFTNVNESQAVQAVFSTTVAGLDARLQFFNELDAFKPFLALAASYSPSVLPRFTLSADIAIVNHKDQVTLQRGADPASFFHVEPRALRAFSPVLVGTGYAFTDWLQAKIEYLYDGYSLSSEERRAVFAFLRAQPEMAPLFVGTIWRANLFSQHYWLASLVMPRLWEKIDLFVGYKQSLTDSSARLVGSVAMPIAEVARLEFEYFQFLFGRRNSEFRNDFIQQQVGLKAAFFF